MIRRARSLAVVVLLLGGALALIGSTQTWLAVRLVDDSAAVIEVPGASAVPLLAPLSLAALALALALSIVGRVLRYVFGAIAVLIGGALLFASARIAVERPADAVESAVADATGLLGVGANGTLVSEITSTVWPVVAVVAAILITVAGLFTLATAHRWPGAGRRYRTDAAAVAASDGSRPHDAIDSWDDLSRGEDPTA